MQLSRVSDLVRDVTGSFSSKAKTEPDGLKVIHSPKSDDNAIDIVAVHGLARGFRSWTWGTSKTDSWLASPLPQDIAKEGRNVRVMTFSYDPEALSLQFLVRKVLYGRALNLLQQLKAKRKETSTSRRPLIFIAHSLGGLIVQRALIVACESADVEFRDIELSTGGVVFFGTPDTGIPAESLEAIIRKVAKLSPKPKALRKEDNESVRNDTEWLKKELEAFKPISSAMSIVSFHETVSTTFTIGKLHSSFIVDERSVQRSNITPGKPLDPGQLQIQKRHTGLVKFEGVEDRGYQLFMKRLKNEILPNVNTKANQKWESYDDAEGILKGRRNDFSLNNDLRVPSVIPKGAKMVTRLDLLTKIDEKLTQATKDGDFAIVTVYGPAGVGKTTMIRAYSHRAEDNDKFVFWLNAESRQTIITAFLKLGQHIFSYYWNKYYSNQHEDPEKAKTRLRAGLGLPDAEKLLQTKDFNSMEPNMLRSAVKAVKDWLLRDGNQWLLVYENVEGSFDLLEFLPLTLQGQIILITHERKQCPWPISEMAVGKWTEDEAVDLFIKHLGFDDALSETDASIARLITKALHSDPLAISCAAAYIVDQQPKMSLAKYWNSLSNQVSSLDHSDIMRSKPALEILRVSSMLALNAIPVELFLGSSVDPKQIIGDSKEVTSTVSHLAEENVLQRVPWQELPSGENPDHHRPFLLLGTTRDWVKEHLLKDPAQKARNAWLACTYCVQVIKSREQKSFLPEIQSFGRLMLPHAKRCYALHTLLDKDSLSRIEWQVLGNLCMAQGANSTAIDCFRLAFKSTKSLSSIDRTQTALSLASIYLEQKQPKQCRTALDKIDEKGSWASDRRLDFRVHLARADAAAQDANDLKWAAEQFDQLKQSQDASDNSTITRNTLLALNRLASTLKSLGELERAEALYHRIMTSYRIKYGPSDPVTLEAVEDLARVLELRGDLDGAEELYKESISFKKATLGADHPNTAASLARLATLCDRKYEFDTAEELYVEAQGVLERTLGKIHPSCIATMENHALSFWARAETNESKVGRLNALAQAQALLQVVVETKEMHATLYPNKLVEGSRKRLQDLNMEIKRASVGAIGTYY